MAKIAFIECNRLCAYSEAKVQTNESSIITGIPKPRPQHKSV